MPAFDSSTPLGFFRLQRSLWRAKRAEPRRASELRAGELARVEGVVGELGQLLTSPFTLTRCAFWATRLDQKRIVDDSDRWSGATHMAWSTELSDMSTAPFVVVDDDGGHVDVDLSTALEHRVPMLVCSEHPNVNDDNPALGAYLRSHGVVPHGFMGISGDWVFREACVPIGARVAVYGTVHETLDVAAQGYRDVPAKRLLLRGTEKAPLLLAVRR